MSDTPGLEAALTIDQVAQALSIHHTHVRRLLRRGELRGKKVGAIWRVTPQAVRDFLGEPTP
jgi:excisionase family DNA binding protein